MGTRVMKSITHTHGYCNYPGVPGYPLTALASNSIFICIYMDYGQKPGENIVSQSGSTRQKQLFSSGTDTYLSSLQCIQCILLPATMLTTGFLMYLSTSRYGNDTGSDHNNKQANQCLPTNLSGICCIGSLLLTTQNISCQRLMSLQAECRCTVRRA